MGDFNSSPTFEIEFLSTGKLALFLLFKQWPVIIEWFQTCFKLRCNYFTICVLVKCLWYNLEQKTLRKKCPYSKLFWSTFSRIWTEYGEIRSISPCSIQMQENADQNKSEFGYFSRSESFWRFSNVSGKLKSSIKSFTFFNKRELWNKLIGYEKVTK